LNNGKLILIMNLNLLFAANIAANEVYQSGAKQVSIIELYTSEGRFGCPPADRWLSALKQQDDVFSAFIPLAFHVDYWNYLGWQDTFSDTSYSERQSTYQRLGHSASAYTPELVIDGKDWRGFFNPASRHLPPDPSTQVPGNLVLKAEADRHVVTFNPEQSYGQELVVHIAYLGMGVTSHCCLGIEAE
jgi:hypothetical protein